MNDSIKSVDKRMTTIWKNTKGEVHKIDGPALVRTNGTEEWWVNGKRHRVNGPAIEWADGARWWYLNGRRHREDGPACEYPSGKKKWFLNGGQYTETEYNFWKEFFRTT